MQSKYYSMISECSLNSEYCLAPSIDLEQFLIAVSKTYRGSVKVVAWIGCDGCGY
jgi:hypothetical protein